MRAASVPSLRPLGALPTRTACGCPRKPAASSSLATLSWHRARIPSTGACSAHVYKSGLRLGSLEAVRRRAEDAPQIDPKSSSDTPHIDARTTPDRRPVDLGSTLSRPQPGSTPDRPGIGPRSIGALEKSAAAITSGALRPRRSARTKSALGRFRADCFRHRSSLPQLGRLGAECCRICPASVHIHHCVDRCVIQIPTDVCPISETNGPKSRGGGDGDEIRKKCATITLRSAGAWTDAPSIAQNHSTCVSEHCLRIPRLPATYLDHVWPYFGQCLPNSESSSPDFIGFGSQTWARLGRNARFGRNWRQSSEQLLRQCAGEHISRNLGVSSERLSRGRRGGKACFRSIRCRDRARPQDDRSADFVDWCTGA